MNLVILRHPMNLFAALGSASYRSANVGAAKVHGMAQYGVIQLLPLETNLF
jgi:hypothetical protein